MGPDKKKFKATCHWLFLKKKSLDLPINPPIKGQPIKVKTKNQDQSPPSKKSQIS